MTDMQACLAACECLRLQGCWRPAQEKSPGACCRRPSNTQAQISPSTTLAASLGSDLWQQHDGRLSRHAWQLAGVCDCRATGGLHKKSPGAWCRRPSNTQAEILPSTTLASSLGSNL